MKLSKILVPSDLSPDAGRPLAAIAAVASHFGAEICLLHVVLDLHLAPLSTPLSAGNSTQAMDAELRQAKMRLDEERRLLGSEAVTSSVVLRAPEIARTVCQYAKEIGADWIALSTHGRTGWRHLALGSIAEAILRHSELPVLSFPRSKA